MGRWLVASPNLECFSLGEGGRGLSRVFSPWAYSVRNKLKTDAPLYANESEKVGYALSQMEAPIFGAMHSWVADMGDSLSADA